MGIEWDCNIYNVNNLPHLYMFSPSKSSGVVNWVSASSSDSTQPYISSVRSIIFSYRSDSRWHLKHFTCLQWGRHSKNHWWVQNKNESHVTKTSHNQTQIIHIMMVYSSDVNLWFKTASKSMLYKGCFLQSGINHIFSTQSLQAYRLHWGY